MTWPEDLAEALTNREYYAKAYHTFLLETYTPPDRQKSDLQIIPIRAAYAQARQFYRRRAVTESRADHELAEHLADTRIDLLDEPRLSVLLGRLDGRPVGVAGVVTLGNIGVIDPAFTDPDYRGQGIARSLMAHVLEHCQRALFESVILRRSEGCWSIPFYESLGFRRVTSFTSFRSADSGPRPAQRVSPRTSP